MRYLLTLILLSFSVFSNAEQITSPFNYRVLSDEVTTMYYAYWSADTGNFSTKPPVCDAVNAQIAITRPEVQTTFDGTYCRSTASGGSSWTTLVNQRPVSTNSCPEQGQSIEVYLSPNSDPSGDFCHTGCEYALTHALQNQQFQNTETGETFDGWKIGGNSKKKACEKVPFEKPDDNCPSGQHKVGGTCQDICPSTSTWDETRKTCVVNNNPDDPSEPDPNDPQPDPTDGTSCTNGHQYNVENDSCEKPPEDNSGDGNGDDCTQEEKDANNGQCPASETPSEEPPKPSQCVEYNEDGTCKQREGNITCDSFKPFCELKTKLEEFTDKFDFSTEELEDKESQYDSKIDQELSNISGDHKNRGFIEANIFRTDRVNFSGSCPADVSVNIPLASFTISYQPICDLFVKLSSVLIALSYLSALYTFSRFI